MNELGKSSASRRKIGEEAGGQRIDNYLLKVLKGVPKSHIYRILRSGEVRVNSGRIGADYRLQPGDQLRLPPVRIAVRTPGAAPPMNDRLERAIVFEDAHLLILDKPSGLAVHGGSGVNFGVIEQLRARRPHAPFLELVHRLDRDTSGVLLLAKKRSALKALHDQLRAGSVRKYYVALVKGAWNNQKMNVHLKLRKHVMASGERRVSVDTEGQDAHTVFELQRKLQEFSLLRAELKTGRTHQIRVHLSHLGFPIAGDDKYGDPDCNKQLSKAGLKRMFLHAASVSFKHPASGKTQTVTAPLPVALQKFMDEL